MCVAFDQNIEQATLVAGRLNLVQQIMGPSLARGVLKLLRLVAMQFSLKPGCDFVAYEQNSVGKFAYLSQAPMPNLTVICLSSWSSALSV